MESIRLRPAEHTKHVGLVYGAYIAIGHLAFFWLAWLLGFLDIPELRVLNVVIQGVGIYLALKQYRKMQGGSLNYFRAMSVGFAASAVGTVIFAVAPFFTFQADHGLFETIMRNEPMGRYLYCVHGMLCCCHGRRDFRSVFNLFADELYGYG